MNDTILAVKLAIDSNIQCAILSKDPQDEARFWAKALALKRELESNLWDLWHFNKKDAYLDIENLPRC